MIPLLLTPPAGRPARVLGAGLEVVPILQNLSRVSWPVILHEPTGGGGLRSFPGIQITTASPNAPGLRQSSLVLITSACRPDWRESARRDLEGSGVPTWDAVDPRSSTVHFPIWFPGTPLSMAVWGVGGTAPWEAGLAEDFVREMGGCFEGLLRLAEELRHLGFGGADDEGFRRKVVTRIASPEVLTLLLKGEFEQAKTLAMKIIGTTTRSLE